MPIYFTMRPLWFYFLPPGALFRNSACGIISQIGALRAKLRFISDDVDEK